jgi:hypothetical protein
MWYFNYQIWSTMTIAHQIPLHLIIARSWNTARDFTSLVVVDSMPHENVDSMVPFDHEQYHIHLLPLRKNEISSRRIKNEIFSKDNWQYTL